MRRKWILIGLAVGLLAAAITGGVALAWGGGSNRLSALASIGSQSHATGKGPQGYYASNNGRLTGCQSTTGMVPCPLDSGNKREGYAI